MVIKSKRGRRRYIAFSTEPSAYEEMMQSMGSSLRRASIDSFKIIQYDGVKGIVRVRRQDQKAAVEALGLPSEGIRITTLAASGTLRTLRERFFLPK